MEAFEAGDLVDVVYTGIEYTAHIPVGIIQTMKRLSPHRIIRKNYANEAAHAHRYKLENSRYMWPPDLLRGVEEKIEWEV